MSGQARDLLDEGNLFEVLEHDHPEFQHYVSFDDEIAHEYDDAIDRLVDEVAVLPGVSRAVREDREVLLVGGSIDHTTLEAWLAAWWRSELHKPSPEQAAEFSPPARASRRFWPRRRGKGPA